MKNLHFEPATQFILPCIVTIFSKGWFGNKYLILVKSLDCAAKSRITWLGTHCNQCIGQKLQFGLATTFFFFNQTTFLLDPRPIRLQTKYCRSEWVAQSNCCSNIYTIKILDCAEWGGRELDVSTLLTLTYCIAKLSHRYLYMACWIEINHFTYKFQLMDQHFFSIRMRGADKEAQHNDQKNTLLKQQQLRQIFSETSLTSSRDVRKLLVGFNKNICIS